MLSQIAIHRLKKSIPCSGLGDAEIETVAEALHPVLLGAGDVVYRPGDDADAMYIVIRGRIRISMHRGGREEVLNHLGPGSHFGELAILTGERRMSIAAATVHTELLQMTREDFLRLLSSVPGFAANLSKSLGHWLRGAVVGAPRIKKAASLAIVGGSPKARAVAFLFAAALVEKKRKVQVLSDSWEGWREQFSFPIDPLPSGLSPADRAYHLRERVNDGLEHFDHVIIDLPQTRVDEELPVQLMVCEEVWWIVDQERTEWQLRSLQAAVRGMPGLHARVHLLWMLQEGDPPPPAPDRELALAQPTFFLVSDGDEPATQRLRPADVSRLVHHVIGWKIGLALGGGGARGMAHIGVLRALNAAGIYFDMVAGTSIGSLVGLFHAAGFPPERMLELARQELVPRWLWRLLPGRRQWFFLWMFRTGGWERKLRRYMTECSLEQLLIPFYPIAVDLIGGEAVVRERGDAVQAVLESLNFPGAARPMFRDGQALVDGGVLSNVPADALRDRGCELIVAVDIAANLSRRYGKNRSTTPADGMKYPGVVETMFRLFEIQQFGLNRMHTSPHNVVITPDVSKFSFTDFSRAEQMAEIGRLAAEQVLPELQQILAEFYARP